MNTMFNIEESLKSRKYFIDNEYLSKYCTLISRNLRNVTRGRLTNKHHIIPKSWFKLNGEDVDNSLKNLVNLYYRDHILAHYYLCLCTEDPLMYANELAFFCLLSRKQLNYVDKQLLHCLPLYNNIYESYIDKKRLNYNLYNS